MQESSFETEKGQTSPSSGVPLDAIVIPRWIVNDIGELGVEVNGRCFFLYKGDNIEYENGLHDDGTPMMYRPVGKREFGETQWPDKWIQQGRCEDRYTVDLVFTPGLSDGKPEDYKWIPLPIVPVA